MQVAIYTCGAIGCIGAIIISLLMHYHKDIPLVWVTFATVVVIVLGICLFWQSKIWEKQTVDKQIKEPEKQSTGIAVRNSENVKVYGNTVIGAGQGYLSEGNKNIEFKDNKHMAPKR
jgi:hypothetical protein